MCRHQSQALRSLNIVASGSTQRNGTVDKRFGPRMVELRCHEWYGAWIFLAEIFGESGFVPEAGGYAAQSSIEVEEQ